MRFVGHVFAYDKRLPLSNAFVWCQPSDYRHALYTVKLESLGYIYVVTVQV